MRSSCHVPTARRALLLAAAAMVSTVTPLGAARISGSEATARSEQAADIDFEAAVLQTFESRVLDYVALHRRLEASLPPLQTSDDISAVRAATETLARQIRAGRGRARPGALFTPDVARLFRARMAACLTSDEIEAILAEEETDEPVIVPKLTVNTSWPEGVPFNFVPPRLIAVLPPLPEELQYRIIGRTLVLWDHHANLIVDLLPAAFTT